MQLQTYILTASIDEGVLYMLKFDATGVHDFFKQFFPEDNSEKYHDITKHLLIDTGSYYNRTPITVEKIVQSIYHSRVDGDSEVRFQLFEFIQGNPRGTDITYTLDKSFSSFKSFT